MSRRESVTLSTVTLSAVSLSSVSLTAVTTLAAALWAAPWAMAEQVADLPEVSAREPVPVPHFPDALHAVVWRNWQLVEPQRLATVLGTTPENIVDLAASMGLPREAPIPPQMHDRGYITLIRRNWHLLPYEQLTALLDITAQELAFLLREDDFLYIKLGRLKPRTAPLTHSPPTDAARLRAAEIKQFVQEHFGDALKQTGEPRFQFVTALGEPPAAPTTPIVHDVPGKPADQPRFIYSYCAVFGDPLVNPAIDPYPDGLLARLRDLGVNGVWMHVVLRQLAPGGPNFPEWGAGHEQRLANLRKLVARARRFGVDVYLYMNEPRAMPVSFFANRPDMAGVHEGDHATLCTSDPRVRSWLSDSLAHVFREVPDLGGIFTITASENLTHCGSHGGQAKCPRCRKHSEAEMVADVNALMEQGVHRSAPDAKVIAYDWGWSGHGDAPEAIARLPSSLWLMSVSEWSQPFVRGGVSSKVGEYSMSVIGPGPRATRHWQLAKQRGLKTVAKVQFNNTWELASVPYLPVMDLVAEHSARLSLAGVDGLMLSWSLGGYPSPNLELAQAFTRRPAPSQEEALQALAERRFGAEAAPHVRSAWTRFSQAFQEFPYSGNLVYNGPQHMGPANLLYQNPTGYSSTMVCFPYDDIAGWRPPYPPDVLAAQFGKVAAGWTAGLEELQAAQSLVPAALRSAADADLRIAQAVQRHFASSANQIRFVIARDALAQATDSLRQRQLRSELIGILDNEIELARDMYRLAAADSRLGFEASNHYFYVPHDLIEKAVNCAQLRAHYAPP